MIDLKEATLDLHVEKMAYGGSGIAKLDGKTYFIDEAIPGDKVRVQIFEDKKTFARARVISFLELSKLRKESFCPYKQCGGCQWNEATYEVQQDWKKDFVKNALEKITKIPLPEDFSFVASKPQHYRNRVLLRGEIQENHSVGVGFFRKKTRTQIHIEHCAITSPLINKVIEKINLIHVNVKAQKFRIELQEFPYFASTQTAAVTAVIHRVESKNRELEDFVDAVGRIEEVIWAGLSVDLDHAPVLPIEERDGTTFFSSPGQFYQINLELNHILRSLVKEEIERDAKLSSVLDLFCGSGNLSLSLGHSKRRITGVEISKKAIKIAKHAAKFNKLNESSYKTIDSVKYLSDLSVSKKKFDVIILDPPRAGIKDGVEALRKILAKKILYVSCDPNTLARDLKSLCVDYKLTRMVCFDFFPQTFHVETLAILEKKSK